MPIVKTFLSQDWNDVNLKWNKSDYGDIGDIRIPPKYIWKPDLLMYNRLVMNHFSLLCIIQFIFQVLMRLSMEHTPPM